MLTRIRNALNASHTEVAVPYSKIKNSLLTIMKDENFIKSMDYKDGNIVVKLNYFKDKTSVIHGLKRVSKPGHRKYVNSSEIPVYHGGLGVGFLSTSQGILTNIEAKKKNVGGELLFYIW